MIHSLKKKRRIFKTNMETHISLPAEAIFHIGSWQITNAHLTSILITGLVFVLCLWARRHMALVPSKAQVAFEMLHEYVFDQLKSSFGSEQKARSFFPFFMTMLIFIAIANQFSLIPLIFQIIAGEHKLFRLPTSDLSFTVGLAVFVVLFSNILAFKIAPIKHLGKYINISGFFKIRKPSDIGQAFLDFLLGLMDIISEIAKVLSLSFRLFGNIFAGEVMVAVIAGLSVFTMFLVPIPFIALGIFSGVIQALVFFLLSIEFIAGTIRDYGQTDD